MAAELHNRVKHLQTNINEKINLIWSMRVQQKLPVKNVMISES